MCFYLITYVHFECFGIRKWRIQYLLDAAVLVFEVNSYKFVISMHADADYD